jgi:hypothetical protein
MAARASDKARQYRSLFSVFVPVNLISSKASTAAASSVILLYLGRSGLAVPRRALARRNS